MWHVFGENSFCLRRDLSGLYNVQIRSPHFLDVWFSGQVASGELRISYGKKKKKWNHQARFAGTLFFRAILEKDVNVVLEQDSISETIWPYYKDVNVRTIIRFFIYTLNEYIVSCSNYYFQLFRKINISPYLIESINV